MLKPQSEQIIWQINWSDLHINGIGAQVSVAIWFIWTFQFAKKKSKLININQIWKREVNCKICQQQGVLAEDRFDLPIEAISAEWSPLFVFRHNRRGRAAKIEKDRTSRNLTTIWATLCKTIPKRNEIFWANAMKIKWRRNSLETEEETFFCKGLYDKKNW